jgi:hypothetical protein
VFDLQASGNVAPTRTTSYQAYSENFGTLRSVSTCDVAFGPAGEKYVSLCDANPRTIPKTRGAIQVWSRSGADYTLTREIAGNVNTKLKQPIQIAVDGEGYLWVANAAPAQGTPDLPGYLTVFAPGAGGPTLATDGTTLAANDVAPIRQQAIGGYGSCTATANSSKARGVVVNGDDVYVLIYNNKGNDCVRVEVYSRADLLNPTVTNPPVKRLLQSTAFGGATPDYLLFHDGQLIIPDSTNLRILFFDAVNWQSEASTTPLKVISGANTTLNMPWGLAVDPAKGEIFVADRGNKVDVYKLPVPISASQSTVSASPASVAANGTATSTITVTLKDANGNAISGEAVSLAQSAGGSSTISAASGTSNA